MNAPSGSKPYPINDDEAFARELQEEEDKLYQQQLRMKALTKADQTLALQLQKELTTVDLESDTSVAQQSQQQGAKNKTFYEDLVAGTPSGSKRKHFIDLVDDGPDMDFALAKQLQQEEDDQRKLTQASFLSFDGPQCNLTDEHDPNPDLHGLFLAFNDMYFSGRLNMVEVKWSKKMTSCAGTCRYQPAAGLCTVTLSEALLKFRTRTDMVNTLLHEMIHALLFVTQRMDNHESHGPEFLREADRINKLAGTNITVYHTFHDEVNHYKTHVWKCNGPCQHRAPYYGKVSRSMNRPPQKADRWFAAHESSCGGTFVKISSPALPPPKNKKKKQESQDIINKKMTDYLLRESPPPK